VAGVEAIGSRSIATMKHLSNWTTETLFNYVHGNHLVYNTCWEDPRLDREVLGLGPDDELVLITWTHDAQAQRRSFELLAREFSLTVHGQSH